MTASAVGRFWRGRWPAWSCATAAVAIGAAMGLAVSVESVAPVAAVMVPLLAVSFGPRRLLAPFLGVLAYFLVCLRGLFEAAHDFFPSPAAAHAGQVGLVATCALMALMWTAARSWVSTPWRAACFAVAATVCAALPPLWIVGGIAHPLLGLGFLWAGGGWLAIAALLVATFYAARSMFALSPAQQCALLVVGLLAGLFVDATPGDFRGNQVVRASSTRWPGRGEVELDAMTDRITKVGKLLRAMGPLGVKWVVLPESTIPRWTPALQFVVDTEIAQEAKRQGVETWLGITTEEPDPDLAVAVFGKDGSRRSYHARQPMPLSLWRPWDPSGYRAHWFQPGIVPSWIGPVYLSICYEDLMPGMFLWDMLRQGRPTAIVSVANSWYLPPATALAQARHVESMARLFSLPLLRAANTR